MSALGEVEVPTPGLVATAPCCGSGCAPFVREYADERRVWWVVCAYCGDSYRIDDGNLHWLRRDPATGQWHPGTPPDLAVLDRVLGREND